jgi:putative peptidoglycan lipid II flippase
MIDRGYLLSFAVSISGFLHFLLIFYVLKKQKFSLRFTKKKDNKSLKDFSKLAWPQTISGFAVQFNILISGLICSFKEGGISILYYAERLYQLPLALIGISIGTVILPHLTSLNINNQKKEMKSLLSNTIKIALALIIPAAFGLIILSETIVSVIYEYGVFGSAEVKIVSTVLIGFSLGLPAYVLIRIFSSAFYSMSDTKNPLKFSLYAISINIVLSVPLFIGFGVIGIAYATSVSAWIHVIIFYKKLKELSLVFFGKDTLADIIKVLFSSAIMFLIISLLINNINLSYPAISLVILVMIGLLSYLICLFLIGFYRKDDIKTFIKDF